MSYSAQGNDCTVYVWELKITTDLPSGIKGKSVTLPAQSRHQGASDYSARQYFA